MSFSVAAAWATAVLGSEPVVKIGSRATEVGGNEDPFEHGLYTSPLENVEGFGIPQWKNTDRASDESAVAEVVTFQADVDRVERLRTRRPHREKVCANAFSSSRFRPRTAPVLASRPARGGHLRQPLAPESHQPWTGPRRGRRIALLRPKHASCAWPTSSITSRPLLPSGCWSQQITATRWTT